MQNGKIKARVLRKNPNLKLLYTELVLGKEITEEEFWDGREVRKPSRKRKGAGLTVSRPCYRRRNWHIRRNQVEPRDSWTIDSILIQERRGKWQLGVQVWGSRVKRKAGL